MVKKRQRLSKREFEHLLKHGQRIHGRHMTLVVLPAEVPTALNGNVRIKYGVVVSKKAARKATVRHALRRKIYTILLHGPVHATYVACIARSSAATCTYRELEEEIVVLLRQVRPR